MELTGVCAVYFSPTGTTARTAVTVGQALSDALGVPLREMDLTTPPSRGREYRFTGGEAVVAACPTYAGKLPNKILPDLKARLHGEGTLAAPVVTYGNRSFDNSLAELTALLTENGFRPVSAAAFACRHAFTDALGFGRPDSGDRREMEDFARRTAERVREIQRRLDGGEALPAPVSVPGDAAAPYYVPLGTDGQPARFLKAKPKTDLSRCCRCGVCARRCPMGAIDAEDVSSVTGTCIKCQSCVRRCTRRAKYFDDPAFLSHVAMLEREYGEAKGNSTFF